MEVIILSNIGIPYEVKKGDTLWDIAAEQLGNPMEWPKLFAFNNQSNVIASGARRMQDPDMIYAGSIIRIPIIPNRPRPIPTKEQMKSHKPNFPTICKNNLSSKIPSPARFPKQRSKPNSLKDQIPQIQMPVSFAFEFKGDPIIVNGGTFTARIYQEGRVLINPQSTIPLTLVFNGGFEVSSKQMAKTAFAKLQSETSVKFNEDTLGITFSNKMIDSASNISGPKTEIGVETSSSKGIPILKVAIVYDELEGYVGMNKFVTSSYKILIEIEPKLPKLQPIPIQQPLPSPAPVPRTDWSEIARNATTATIIVAGILTIAYGASVVFSGGGTSVGAPAYASVMSIILVGGTTTSIIAQ